jgi:hypothetical protein
MNVLYSDQHSLDSKISDLFDDDSNPNEDAEKLYRTLKGKNILFIFIYGFYIYKIIKV